MADYYPLLARAVQGLDPNTAEARADIYGRARGALNRQLSGLDSASSPGVAARELAALDAVIERLELEFDQWSEPELPALDAPMAEPARPQAPRRTVQPVNRKPFFAVFAAVGMVVVAAVATLAFLRRHEPPAVTNRVVSRTQVQPDPEAVPAKPADRIGQPGQPSPPTPSPVQRPVVAPPPRPDPVQPPVAVANRMVLILEGTDRPENVLGRSGVVVWRNEAASGVQGQPLDQLVTGTIDVPDARIRAEVTLRRNRDSAFPASHTLQLRFTPAAGSEVGAVKDVLGVEMREVENQPGYRLIGQGVAVMENVFLIALTLAEPALTRNTEMIRRRPLVYIEFSTTSGRRGAMVLDKGVSGQQAFEDAFRAWQ
ncbi:MAG: hypothetical protein ACRC7G_07690 [Beijerinckiaceae bacterium]